MLRAILACVILAFASPVAFAANYQIDNWDPSPAKLSVVPGYKDIRGDLDGAFNYVKTHIRFQIYSGAMRGIRGTLISRSGNSLDQSLLLAHLLSHRSFKTRIVKSILGGTALKRAISVFKDDQKAIEATAESKVERLDKLISTTTDSRKKASLLSLRKERDRLLNCISGMLKDDSKTLKAYLQNPAGRAAKNFENLNHKLTREARDHYWVEVQQPDGSWLSLDPTLKLNKGQAISSQIAARWDFPKIPNGLFHSVQFSIHAFFQQGGEIRSTAPLTLKSTSAALTGLPIFLVHPAKGDGFGTAALFSVLSNILVKQSGINQLPVFYIDGQMYKGDPLKIQPWKGSSIFGGGFGGAFGGASPSPVSVMAEILTITITHPDGSIVQVERPIFDLAGSSERHNHPKGPWKKRASLNQNKNNQPPELQRLFAYTVDTGAVTESYIRTVFPVQPGKDTIAAVFSAAGKGDDALIRKSDQLEAEYLNHVVLNKYDEVVRELAPNEELIKDASGKVRRDSNGNSLVRKTSANPDGPNYKPTDFTLPQSQTLMRFRRFEDDMRALINHGAYFGYIAQPNITSFFLGADGGPPPPDEYTAARITPYLGFDLVYHSLRMNSERRLSR